MDSSYENKTVQNYDQKSQYLEIGYLFWLKQFPGELKKMVLRV